MGARRSDAGSTAGGFYPWPASLMESARCRTLIAGALALAMLVLLLILSGCDDDQCIGCVDTKPTVPTGVFSVTGDETVTLYWNHIWDDGIVAYVIYYSTEYDGDYYPIDTIAADQNFDSFTGLHWYDVVDIPVWDPLSDSFVFMPLQNGERLFYAVTSVNAGDFESDLSYEEIFDTPRPEGYNVELFDFNMSPPLSGFDFSRGNNGRGDPTTPTQVDVMVLFEDGIPFVQVARPNDVRLQDYGTFVDASGFVRLDWVDWAPLAGYSETGKAELIGGHAYILVIREPEGDTHYAKFAVTNIRAQSVIIDWAYQIAVESRELKAPEGPKSPVGESEIVRF